MLITPAPTPPANPILVALRRHLDNHTTANQEWPADALYAVEYSLKAWPCAATQHVQFFASKELMEQWYARQCAWGREEDNHFEVNGMWFWDLGPNYIQWQDWQHHLLSQ